MVEEKELKKLDKLDIDEKIKKLKELEAEKEKELGEIKRLLDKNIKELAEETEEASVPQEEAKKAEEEPEAKPATLEAVVSDEKAQAPAAVEYGRPIAQEKFDIGSLYEEVKKFSAEAKGIFEKGYQMNQREEGEFYQLRKMVEQAELASTYIRPTKIQNELLNLTEQMLDSIQTYKTKKATS